MGSYCYSDDLPQWANNYLWPPLIRILDRAAPPPASVFELGCGNGATARMLAAKGYSVTAVDPSPTGITQAKPYESATLRFSLGSTSDDLAGTFGQFPLVLSLEVIEHCPSAREFMASFASLIAPGGIGILSTPYHGYLKNVAVAATGKFDHHFDPLWEGGHLKFFSIPKLRELFEESGFRRYEFHRIGRVPMLARSTLAVLYT
ncbi:MAG TPA: class I SAM-dependent methyltransferase [Thermoanaerobaculia bacterium]